ncbi:RloB family protein [Desulfurivibrio dismutans]|uniref:RloB family protein n=1 Tax=Desulfurivibrio dismutans TaxID=1398908 RepID=UPI0023DC6196|nr:RloB family protein [Desulfurivibrio alkaliphilus]MDF1614362.1 RloB family protein [Desulfurivibrio alkaliphilus]
MGSDDLFHKRKERKAASLSRSRARRAPYDRVLIVCEGSKTEPHYLQELIDFYKLNTANIDVIGRGSDPQNVAEYAISRSREDQDYDRIYCVFDQDRHTSYQATLDKIRQTRLSKKRSLQAITSVPCFEIWLLLHFTYTTRQFGSGGPDSSICAEVITALRRKHLPKYDKGQHNVFRQLEPHLPKAMKNASQLREYNQTNGTDHPSTQMDELVDYLRNLRQNG